MLLLESHVFDRCGIVAVATSWGEKMTRQGTERRKTDACSLHSQQDQAGHASSQARVNAASRLEIWSPPPAGLLLGQRQRMEALGDLLSVFEVSRPRPVRSSLAKVNEQ